ncbi:MAG: hypothetical protein WBE37_13625 [Bryobacteraceae bacterium]
MKWKLVSAFAVGAGLASGIVYLAVRQQDGGTVVPPIAQSLPQPVSAQPAPPIAPAASPESHPVPVREKPSPMPPPVRHKQELVIARNTAPPVEPQPEPAPPPAAPIAPAAPATPAAPVQPENVPVQNVSLPNTEARVPPSVTLAAGTLLSVRIGETLSSARNQVGDIFLATLTQPLVVEGWVIAERGARVEGRVVEAAQAGRVKGASHLGISLVRLATSDGQYVRVRTEPFVKDGASSTGTDAAKVGAGAAIGAIIGAIAGGGKGAAIGAGAGGAAGAGDVLLTRGKPAEIPVERRVNFKVQDSVTITERIN